MSEAYIISTFRFCSLISMFCSTATNNLIDKIHKRSLHVVFEIEDANFEDLLIKGYLRYKTIFFQNVSSQAQVKNFFIS